MVIKKTVKNGRFFIKPIKALNNNGQCVIIHLINASKKFIIAPKH